MAVVAAAPAVAGPAAAVGGWTRRGRVTAVLVASSLLVLASVAALGFYRPSYAIVVVGDWVEMTMEAIDGDAEIGPVGAEVGERLDALGDALGAIVGAAAEAVQGEAQAGGAASTVAPLWKVANTSAAPPPSAPANATASAAPAAAAVVVVEKDDDEDPCKETPRTTRGALSADARAVLAAYEQVHRQQMEWLRTGDPRFRAVLFQCTASAACGGLGDRLNGIVSAFYLAVMTQRAIFIEVTTPVALSFFFQPSTSIDWRWPPAGWAAHPRGDAVAYLDSIDYYNPLETQLATRGANRLLAVDADPTLIIFHTNLQFWMDITAGADYVDRSPMYSLVQPVRTAGDLYGLAYAALLRPTCYLSEATRLWEANLFSEVGPTVPRIGIHLRTGLDPSFHDMHRFAPEHLSAFAERLPSAVAALRARVTFDAPVNASALPVLFVVGDYPPALELMLKQLRRPSPNWAAVVTVPLTPQLPLTHLERSTDGAIYTPEGNLRTFLEWNLLRRMDASILGRTGYSMSASRTVCVPALYFPKIDTPVADYKFYPRGMCWPQERPKDEG